MSLINQVPLWIWPALSLAAALIYLYRNGRWPFDGPAPAPVAPTDPLSELHTEILRGLLSKQGLLPPISTPTNPRIIQLPRRFAIVPVDD